MGKVGGGDESERASERESGCFTTKSPPCQRNKVYHITGRGKSLIKRKQRGRLDYNEQARCCRGVRRTATPQHGDVKFLTPSSAARDARPARANNVSESKGGGARTGEKAGHSSLASRAVDVGCCEGLFLRATDSRMCYGNPLQERFVCIAPTVIGSLCDLCVDLLTGEPIS